MKSNILHKILAHKKNEVEAQRKKVQLEELRERVKTTDAPRSLAAALKATPQLAVIAEVKKGSPSAGTIRPNFNPVEIAQQYAANGADALSVLTDEHFFQGHLDYIAAIRPHVDVPILRKEFIIDEYQLYEARAAGADAVLLIVAALKQSELEQFLFITDKLKMQAIVEVHNEKEMERALQAGAAIVGINNRNLETFEIDLGVTERLAPIAGNDIVLVGESGISKWDDLQRMAAAGVDAVLVGSHFMRQDDPGEALAAFKKGISHPWRGRKE
ncbi:MAG: indole-3-glycerol phosphate synthase TrpC [Deferribacteres bacterium]|nr:indole-3-glycerol phosphate synthase TrpC [candidate division KSB1 bacterium]MCB9501812.1 indole-3-glycerol phosphate synthase TrpC [Deferribacteres bacterium]